MVPEPKSPCCVTRPRFFTSLRLPYLTEDRERVRLLRRRGFSTRGKQLSGEREGKPRAWADAAPEVGCARSTPRCARNHDLARKVPYRLWDAGGRFGLSRSVREDEATWRCGEWPVLGSGWTGVCCLDGSELHEIKGRVPGAASATHSDSSVSEPRVVPSLRVPVPWCHGHRGARGGSVHSEGPAGPPVSILPQEWGCSEEWGGRQVLSVPAKEASPGPPSLGLPTARKTKCFQKEVFTARLPGGPGGHVRTACPPLRRGDQR